MRTEEHRLYLLFGGVLAGLCVLGLALDGPGVALEQAARLQLRPARLVQDFVAVAGQGAALVNATVVAGMGLLFVRVLKIRLSGPTIAAVLTMLGFGLFGKTPLNALPVFIGVGISAAIAGKRYQEYILMALFGTATGPLVSALVAEVGLAPLPGLAVAVAAGTAVGMLLPPAAIAMLRLHQGFSLYNIGLTAGFLAVFAAAILVAAGGSLPAAVVWAETPSTAFLLIAPGLSLLLIVAGLASGPRNAVAGLVKINRLSGRLPSDFMTMTSVPAALVNAGLIGAFTWAYVLIVGGELNGPTLGGILTAVGFALFGKHLRNCWPVFAGVVAATLLFGKSPAAPGPLLAALFGLTLAPLAGEFGAPIGFVAGFLHLALVERTGAWHLGINLYNNGFAGGLTAALMVAVIEWYRSARSRGAGSRAGQRPADRGRPSGKVEKNTGGDE